MKEVRPAATGGVVFFEDSRRVGIRVRRLPYSWMLYCFGLALVVAAGLVGVFESPRVVPHDDETLVGVSIGLLAVVIVLSMGRWPALLGCVRPWTRYPRLAHGAWIEASKIEPGGAYRATPSCIELFVDHSPVALKESGARDGAPVFSGAGVAVSTFVEYDFNAKTPMPITRRLHAVDLVVPERTYQVAAFGDATAAFDLAHALAEALSLADPPAEAVELTAYTESFDDARLAFYALAGSVLSIAGAVTIVCLPKTSLAVVWPAAVFGGLGVHIIIDLLIIQRIRVVAKTKLSYVVRDERGFHAREIPYVAPTGPLPHEWVAAEDYPPPPPPWTKPPPWP